MIKWIGIALVLAVFIPFISKILLNISRQKALDRRRRQIDDEIRKRLQSIAADVAGQVTGAPALETPRGTLVLLATQAPKSSYVDITKFTAPAATSKLLSVVPLQDAAKSLQLKDLKPVTLDDPAVTKAYAVSASDEAFARKIATPALVEKLQALDQTIHGRCRLQITPGGVTVLLTKGLIRPDDLKAFLDGGAAVADLVRPLL